MDRKKRLNPESRRAYLEGLRKYREKGVPILIDGKEADESQWDKIFEIHGGLEAFIWEIMILER